MINNYTISVGIIINGIPNKHYKNQKLFVHDVTTKNEPFIDIISTLHSSK